MLSGLSGAPQITVDRGGNLRDRVRLRAHRVELLGSFESDMIKLIKLDTGMEMSKETINRINNAYASGIDEGYTGAPLADYVSRKAPCSAIVAKSFLARVGATKAKKKFPWSSFAIGGLIIAGLFAGGFFAKQVKPLIQEFKGVELL